MYPIIMLSRKIYNRFLQLLNKNQTKNKDLNLKIQKSFKNRKQVKEMDKHKIINKIIKIKPLNKTLKLLTKY
jgi:hypothetical protein